MTHYVLSMYQPDGNPPPPEVLGPIMERVSAWRDEVKAAGAWVFTAGLHPASTATVLRIHDDRLLTTDGPFTEGKEHIGGFTILNCPDLDAALAWGGELVRITGLPIEVRPLRGEPAG